MHAPDQPPLHISLLAAPETSPSVLYGLVDVLGTAGAIYPEITTGKPGRPLFDVNVVAVAATPFRCGLGMMIEPDCALADVASTDCVVVCDMYQPVHEPPHGRYGPEIEWLRRIHADGALLTSVCSGSLILAEAGLLDGREAAGHWCYRELIRRHYPRVRLRDDLVLCLSEEGERIVTAGAVSAWQELAMYLIARFAGREQALQTAKVFLFTEHAEGQLPYAVTVLQPQTADAVIADSQAWIADNLACANPVTCMRERAGLKPRTFARRFRAATGYLPMTYVHALRIEDAKRQLEAATLPVDEVGHAVGYEDPTSFRRLFRRKTGMTPSAYRRKFSRLAAPGGV
ncbi:GlxA family transcriptional regulator [Aquisalimonas asiatica]|uniref:Transcriptional regulator GlxA family, contains an amidase domain and an AraC-type DNA-binding HTH domain n=1 Tax=Aquisalimonas asiatica TaxID=406100 RepID=A0A1H8PWL9_9GAMM|nr:helix-turn-helix domain-containing protein [Aquisalimonas asiatica]SEO46350.1 Transcriptional regulator GlxA family, contains an amidase domain and an AraC-type DNA-binding HTH domain [Aquisalimonas asiatica]